jgi:hypothetical protein
VVLNCLQHGVHNYLECFDPEIPEDGLWLWYSNGEIDND